MEWLWSQGYPVFVPFGHSPDVDLIALIGGRPVTIQVKTSGFLVNDRWSVAICTRGGNQSWNKIVKRFERDRCNFLFVLVADGRRWFIPSDVVEGTTAILLGGPKYAAYEVERGRPFATLRAVPAG